MKINIVTHIEAHIENLQNKLNHCSLEQRKSLTIALLRFYFQLPNFAEVIYKYIKISLDENQLVSDISRENLNDYQQANAKRNAEVDEYADDYETPEPIEILMLDAFANATSDLQDSESLVGLFVGVIDTLDYYENFSECPEYWNDLLAKELKSQTEILKAIESTATFDRSLYQKRYANVTFEEL